MIGALFALFAVALGYGTLVPLVPVYLGASGGGDVAWHTGALPAVFLAAASLAAPLWGHVSDRIGRRVVIAAGCAGAALAVVPFLVEHGLPQLYLLQAVAGVSFGAVSPAALAMLYEAGDARSRSRPLNLDQGMRRRIGQHCQAQIRTGALDRCSTQSPEERRG